MRKRNVILLILLFNCCNNKIEIKSNFDVISFNEYFHKFNEKNILLVFEDVKGLSTRRAGEEMMIEFSDSTTVFFKFGNDEIFNVDKRGTIYGKLSSEKIYEKVKSIYEVFSDLKLISASFDSKQNVRTFSFDIKIIEKSTLPQYEYPDNKFKKDTLPEKGYILYLYDDAFIKSYQFELVKPMLIETNWYYYAI